MANLNIAVQVVANVGSAAKNLGGLRLSLTDLKSGLDIAQQAFSAAQQVIDATVGPTVALATQQRDLARVTGMTAEEAGVMIQATDDMGVSYGSLQAAAEKLNKEGLSLNAENLRSLRAEYLEITDPVERAEFATDKFGKAAGPEMQKVLEATTAEFENYMAAAEDSALVLSGEAVNAARKYEIAQDNMADAVESTKVLVGEELLPILTDLTNFTSDNLVPAITIAADTFSAAATAAEQLTFIYEYQQGQLRLLAQEQGLTTEQIKQASSITQLYGVDLQGMSEATTAGEMATRALALAHQDVTLTAEQATQAHIDATAGLDAHERAAQNAATATDTLTASTYGNITATELLDASTQKYSATVLFKNAAENLSTESAIALGVELGVLDSKTLLAAQAVDDLKAKYDTNKDGAISATEAAAGYTQAIIDLHNNLEALPETTTTNVVTNFITTGGSHVNDGPGSGVNGTGGAVGFAGGGIARGPDSGHWELLHGDEGVVPLEGGAIPVRLSGAGGGININIAIDARGATDPRAVEDAGYRGAQRALREAGMNANIRIRTGGRR